MFAQSLITAVKTNPFPQKRAVKQRHLLLQESPLAGFQYHRANGVWAFLQMGALLRLKREPHNPHDANAVAVWFMNDKLGYIPRNENSRLAALMDRGEKLEVRISKLLDEDDPWQRVRFSVALVV
ncbi:MAG: HIRAN domain-containing protein [Candidatus Polarisedimenticolaceae bacterium]|nr:HIRAN domain-containing protein [Candidatus Polarisedimenticolaceae bacterium]